MVVPKRYDELPTQIPYLIDARDGPTYGELDEHGHGFGNWGIARTNDLSVSWGRAEPGGEVDWHSHAPDFYQLHVVITGRIRWVYKDNDGEERSVEAGPGQAVFLPGGSENKVEVVGDEPVEWLLISPRVSMGRMEFVVEDGGYPSRGDFGSTSALVYDTDNDAEVRVIEDAIANLEEVRERQGRDGDAV